MDLPDDLISLVFEFTINKDIHALLLYHTCKVFKQLITQIQVKNQSYPRRLFYNLTVADIKDLTIQRVECWIDQQAKRGDLIKKACLLGRLEILQWFRANGCEWDLRTMSFAARGGHLEVVKWLRENDCTWTLGTIAAAAEEDRLEIVKWLRENGCVWDVSTFACAARGGHFEVLKWLADNGCPYNQRAGIYAAETGRLQIIKWLKVKDIPWVQ